MIGDTVQGTDQLERVFDEETYGGTFGGPIIKDKLFFFLSYEKFKANRATIAGPVGSGKPVIAGNPAAAIPFITGAQLTQVEGILASRYGFDFDSMNSITGGITLPELDEKKLAKIDWNITDNHRLAVTYQKTDGTRLIEGNRSSSTQLALYSDYYIKGDDLEVYTAQLNSDWSDNFRTELVATRKNVVTIQQPVSGVAGNGEAMGDEEAEIGQFSIGANPAVSGTGTRILAGPDVSRHANELENKVTTFRARGFYDLGDNSFAFGVETREAGGLQPVRPAHGRRVHLQQRRRPAERHPAAAPVSKRDRRCERRRPAQRAGPGRALRLRDLQLLRPGHPADHRGASVTAGFRYQRLTQKDVPLANSFFAARYGFSNSENLDGRDVFLPRLGFDYRPDWDVDHVSRIRITGGYGLFSGGSSTVWVSNSFSNTGVLGRQRLLPAQRHQRRLRPGRRHERQRHPGAARHRRRLQEPAGRRRGPAQPGQRVDQQHPSQRGRQRDRPQLPADPDLEGQPHAWPPTWTCGCWAPTTTSPSTSSAAT